MVGARARAAPHVTQGPDVAREGDGGADGGTWWAGERVRRQVGTTLSSIAWSIRERVHGSGIWRRAALARGRQPSAEPPRGWHLEQVLGLGRAGGLRRGRREYVPVGSGAPSMALTPLRNPPARPPTGSCGASHERQSKKTKSKSRSLRSSMPDFWNFLVAGKKPALPGSIHARRGSTADRGKLSKAGWVRLRGREPHGCGDRASMDGFTASPATGPTLPSHGNPAFALAVAVAVAVALASAGAGRRPAKALPPLPVQCRARFPTTVPRT